MTLNTVPRTTKKASTPNTGRSKVCLQIHIVKFSENPLSNIETKRKEKDKGKNPFFPNDGSS